MNSDSLNMVSRLGEGHMPCNFFLSEPQLKTTVLYANSYFATDIKMIGTKNVANEQKIKLAPCCFLA